MKFHFSKRMVITSVTGAALLLVTGGLDSLQAQWQKQVDRRQHRHDQQRPTQQRREQSEYRYYFREGFIRSYRDGYYGRFQYGRHSEGVFSLLGHILQQIFNARPY